jgi:di/tricarboxylate transporter
MNLAWVSIGALVAAVALSCTTTINVGVLSIVMALVVGVYLGGMSVDAVLSGFPISLFVTLVGVTLLFSIAEINGTLARITGRAVALCRGRAALLPVMFFILGFIIATIGPGGTPSSALLAPAAMAVAVRSGIPPLLMAVMAGNGALAGTLSPFAPTGIVSAGVMTRIGLGGVEWQTFAWNALAHTTVGIGGFLLLGGLRLFGRDQSRLAPAAAESEALDAKQWLTLAGIALFIVAVAAFNVNVGLAALVVAAALTLLRAADEARALQRVPWGVVLMVTGVTVLVSMLERTKGLDLFTEALAGLATTATVAPIVAFGTGVVSVYSSTSGVVLPAFLPTVPGLAERVGVAALPVAWSMNVGASLVDLSSLSTVGALFIAGAPAGTDSKRLFNGLLVWGLSMTVVGAVLAWALFGGR